MPDPSPPRRIVSLVPSWTETVCALGARDRLVGCTRYCVEPADALAEVTRIGGTKNPKLEVVAAQAPDLVLANGEENRAEDIAWLRERFPVFEALPRTVVEAADVVRELGRRLGAEPEAQALRYEIEVQIARGEVERLAGGTVRVFYAIWPKPWMSVNHDTYIHDVLTRAGAINVAAEETERYPSYPPERLRALGVELVLLPDEPYVFEQGFRDEVLSRERFGAGVAVELVSGRDFCWHGAHTGPGLGRALDVLARMRGG